MTLEEFLAKCEGEIDHSGVPVCIPVRKLLAIIRVQADALDFYSKNAGLFIDHPRPVFKSADSDERDFHGAKAREAQKRVEEILNGK